jgi:hypothetical protein
LVAINLLAIHHSQWNHDFSGSLMIQLTRWAGVCIDSSNWLTLLMYATCVVKCLCLYVFRWPFH